MLLSIVVSLYTSRVVLQTLGVEDYGIYGVVGGVVSMFTFLNASMAGATSRFLTYEMGKSKNDESACEDGTLTKLEKTFSTAMLIHICIAGIILLLAGTIGFWFLSNKLVIPENRMSAAYVVYVFSIISMFVTVTQVPYNAAIIAHEKMDVYAYVEILNVLLKLGIVYLLMVGNFDKLILYAGLTLVVSVLIATIYRIYCINHFSETKTHFVIDWSIIKPMLTFSGWDLFGNMSVAISQQGYPFAMNMIEGPVLNAANNISGTVMGTIKGLSLSVAQAFRPPIIKSYAEGNLTQMQNLVIDSSKLSLALLFVLFFPCYFYADYILELWLVEVPPLTVELLRITLVCLVFNLLNIILNIPIHATGNVRLLSIYTGILYSASPFIYYALCKMGVSCDSAYWTIVVIAMIALVTTMFIVKRLINKFSIGQLLSHAYVPFIPLIIIEYCVMKLSNSLLAISIVNLLIVIAVSSLIILFYGFMILMNTEQRKKCLERLKNRINIR